MAKKVSAKAKKQKSVIPKCPSCRKEMQYVVVMPQRKTRLKCKCGKYFDKNIEEIKLNV